MLQFNTIDLEKDAELAIRFRKDSFKVSFGAADDFDEADYLHWLRGQIEECPDGFVMVEEEGEVIGQLELSIREYESEKIGYVNLYYLVPSKRGGGRGQALHAYATDFFKRQQVNEFHLRVAPGNKPAVRFYERIGMQEIGPEVEGKVIRMKGRLED